MQPTTRRNLLAGLAALPEALGRELLGPATPEAEPAAAPAAAPAAPGQLRINPPSHSVTRRG